MFGLATFGGYMAVWLVRAGSQANKAKLPLKQIWTIVVQEYE
jgi:hypothetical protein